MAPQSNCLYARKIGAAGEDIAAHYLQSKGYEILSNNFTVRGGEIDLVARHGKTLVFVEVKMRGGTVYGRGDESVGNLKKRRLARAIDRFLQEKMPAADPDYRVDLLEIALAPNSNEAPSITHHADIEFFAYE